MTGELHLEKPTVEHEVLRGLHFFDETLFGSQNDGAARRGFEAELSREDFDLPPFSSSARGSAATATAIPM